MSESRRRSPFSRILNHPIFQWVIGIYLAIVLVTYGVALLRFNPTLRDAIGSGFTQSYGEIGAISTRAFFGGTEYRFQLKNSGAVFTVFPGTLSSGTEMPAIGAGVEIMHTARGNWVIGLVNKSAPAAPQIVTKQVATQVLEDAVGSAYLRAALSFVMALVIGGLPMWLPRLRQRFGR